MSTQTSTSVGLTATLSAQLNLDGGTCPSCGQDIPPDRIEEISGRIAARDREHALALTSRFEAQFLAERTKIEAKAKADIELEKRQSVEREAQAVQEAKSEAEALMDAKLAEAERVRQESLAAEQKQLEEATAARRRAEEEALSLQARMQQQREANAAALDALKAEAFAREAEIHVQAKQTAEAAVAHRVAKIETERCQSESALRARLTEAETARTAAEQNGMSLMAQLDALQKSKDAKIAEITAAAEADASRIRQEAAESTAAQFQTVIAEKNKAIAEANTKALEAEQSLEALAQQHDRAMAERLNSEREILEKATDEAINAEKARAFEENQKLSNKVNDLQRALEKKTNEELGEGAEIDLFEALRKDFSSDKIDRIRRGEPGADILHVVMERGEKCGTIIYDSKNHKAYRSEHVTKLRADQLAVKAEHAILSTHKFPEGTRQLHVRDGVLLANPARVIMLAMILRQHIVHVHTLRVSSIEREKKTAALYDFINSEQYTQLVRRVDERAADLLKEQEKEIKWHESHWRREGEALRAIQKVRAELDNAVARIISASEHDSVLPEAS